MRAGEVALEGKRRESNEQLSLHVHSCANYDDVIIDRLFCLSFELNYLLTFLSYPFTVSIELPPFQCPQLTGVSLLSNFFPLGRGLVLFLPFPLLHPPGGCSLTPLLINIYAFLAPRMTCSWH